VRAAPEVEIKAVNIHIPDRVPLNISSTRFRMTTRQFMGYSRLDAMGAFEKHVSY
jgi:hypothetical protein